MFLLEHGKSISATKIPSTYGVPNDVADGTGQLYVRLFGFFADSAQRNLCRLVGGLLLVI